MRCLISTLSKSLDKSRGIPGIFARRWLFCPKLDLNHKNRPFGYCVEILEDLVSQGYSGDELVKQFKIQNKNIKKAVTNMLEEADAIAAGEKSAANFGDIFGSED